VGSDREATLHHGRCLCGAVRFAVTGALGEVCVCHCTQCRRQTGHFLASTNVAVADVALEGEDHVRWYRSSESAERGFCGTCGSVLFWRRVASDRLAIAMGSLDKPTGTHIVAHIFAADKGDYYAIEGDAPVFPGDG
jgi:hypothetical protein